MNNLQTAKTVTGLEFQYAGSLSKGIEIYRTHSTFRTSTDVIDLIKSEIHRASPVLMGANRDKPNPYSLGYKLLKSGYSPQHLSYIIPLLIEAGYCKISDTRPFTVIIISK